MGNIMQFVHLKAIDKRITNPQLMASGLQIPKSGKV
jgi:hypothetical protein